MTSTSATVKLAGHLGMISSVEGKKYSRMGDISLDAPQKLSKILELIETQYHITLRRDSVLILINGIEANALDDLDTIIKEDDKVVVVPMFHGG